MEEEEQPDYFEEAQEQMAQIKDSFLAGMITEKQYWAKVLELVALQYDILNAKQRRFK